MLDSFTRSKIDALRDTLVGKLPVPSEQVKQITLGLMYKFMGDLDEEYAKLGSKPFFGGKYERYAWRNIMALTEAPKRAELYVEGIEKMSLNPGIPQLFRDIFKGAFFPFRDPRIIGEFLKGIDEFKYEHSEDLGDAFEYLLQVSGEQGKAGQLRTPRHIIDFIVECVDPQKTDRILDPACGTAGFLVSAYKHILRENTRPGSDRPGSALTTTERNALRDNFTGYDISHDMVRISLVNMYLHLFPNPRIYEYDTLTSQDRWDEDADCILANPPFMTPKGGIRPHNRFQIKAHRSEILFVDYMLEHLSPQGKMGVIVPEGIIFQSNTAYKALRKLLVDGGYLYAVVSLPGGVFNPYSGVKTSILLIDRVLAKKAQDILFVKVENDGFDLGAQRREVEGNELPQTLKAIQSYKNAVVGGKDVRSALQRLSRGVLLSEAKHLSIVPKSAIGEDGDYGLSAERHRVPGFVGNRRWPLTAIGDVVTIQPPKSELSEVNSEMPVSFVPMSQLQEKRQSFEAEETRKLKDVIKGYTYFKNGDVLLAKITPCFENGKAGIAAKLTNGIGFGSTEFIVLRPTDAVMPQWLFAFVTEDRFRQSGKRNMTGTAGQQRLRPDFVRNYGIPLPPLSVQQEIVAELDSYQKVIDGARQVVENYRLLMDANPDWPLVALSEHFSMSSGGTPSKAKRDFWIGKIPWVSPKDMKSDVIVDTEDHISDAAVAGSATKLLPAQTVVCVVRSGILKHSFPVAILSRPMCINQDLIAFMPKTGAVNPRFLLYVLKSRTERILADGIKPGVTVQSFHNRFFQNYPIPLPPITTQELVVARIEEERQLVQANRRLIELFEAKIRDRIKGVWGE